MFKLFKNQHYPFGDSKIFFNFAVRKVGLLYVSALTCRIINASKLINYSNLKKKKWLKKSLKW